MARDTLTSVLAFGQAGCLQSTPRKLGHVKSQTKTILVVDDDEGMRDTLSAILKRNYDVRVAATGEEGLSVLKRADINLMLLDVRMPGMSGLEVLKVVHDHYSEVEVIMVSAVNDVEVAVQAIKDGAYHYITKEFDYDGLRSLVRNALQRQDLSRRVVSLSAQVADLWVANYYSAP